MATLKNIETKIDTLHGDMTYREIMEKKLDYLAAGRRASRDFVIRANIRTLRSGPNRGKVRVDGAVIVMYGRRLRTNSMVASVLVRQSNKFLSSLDKLAETLKKCGY